MLKQHLTSRPSRTRERAAGLKRYRTEDNPFCGAIFICTATAIMAHFTSPGWTLP